MDPLDERLQIEGCGHAPDEAYLREASLEPAAKIATGYERGESGMPSYAGVLSQAQLDSIVLYIKSLR